jgi:mono/diheme cytochrome c family protein
MSKTPFVIFGIFALVCVILLPLIALGKEGDEDAAIVKVAPRDREAKQSFATNCGACHTLAAAGTDGVVGPNLDELLVTSGANTPDQYTGIYQRVLTAVTCGLSGRMPRGILEGENAKQVAQFVAAYAAQIDKGPTVDTGDPKAAPTPEFTVEDCQPSTG